MRNDFFFFFFFSSRRRHTRLTCDWSSDVCSSDLRRHRPESPGPSKESKCHWVVPGAAPALLRALLGLQPHLRSASAQAEQVPPALAGGCDPESLAWHAAHVRS